MAREAYPGSSSIINEKKELIFGTPQWLIDEVNEAKKACGSGVSLTDEFEEMYNTKDRSERLLKTVQAASNDDSETRELNMQRELARRQQSLSETIRAVSDDNFHTREMDKQRELANQQSQDAPLRLAQESVEADTGRYTRREKMSNSSAKPVQVPTTEHSKIESDQKIIIPNIEYKPKPQPDWLTSIGSIALNNAMKRRDTDRVQALQALASFRDCMRRCESSAVANNPAEQERLYELLRDHVHKAEIRLKGVDKYVIRKTNMLTMEGLPSIFMAKKVNYPWDLRADAYQLYLRWYDQDFVPDLLRGIITRHGKNRASDSIDPEWRKNQSLGTSANFHGQGNLVLGQWWPTQLCAVRDRAHGSPQGGISGSKGQGAFSIVLSTGGYQDRDEGDEIWYTGTEAKTNEPTENTQRLIESCEQFPDRPVRVLRSAQVPLKNPYRPNVGLRYDGLYKVVGMERMVEGKEDYLFHLVRCENQHPIRCEANAARRPTKYEEEEFKKLRDNGR